MAHEIKVPRLGWNMEQGVFHGWLKREGEAVRAGEPLFTLEGDKAVQDIEATDSGVLHLAPGCPAPGDVVPVGTLLGYLGTPGEEAVPRPVPARADTGAVPASPSVRRLARQMGAALGQVAGTGPGGRVTKEDVLQAATGAPAPRRRAVTPRARRAARTLGIDTTTVEGTGRNGRVRECDVQAFAARLASPASAVPLSHVRRTIAERLLHSLRSTAPVTLTTTADATNLVSLRRQFQTLAAASGAAVPSYTDLLVKLTACALQAHPLLNARWEGERVVHPAEVHVGIAVDTVAGLLVPVLRDVTRLTLQQVAVRSRELAERARARSLTADALQGGTFTITNLGAFGVEAFTPIINYPECAILGVGCIHTQPVVVDRQVVPRDVVTLSLTFDHRVVDGAPAARFLQTLRQGVENPAVWLVA